VLEQYDATNTHELSVCGDASTIHVRHVWTHKHLGCKKHHALWT
jgi:hypothetical protein